MSVNLKQQSTNMLSGVWKHRGGHNVVHEQCMLGWTKLLITLPLEVLEL